MSQPTTRTPSLHNDRRWYALKCSFYNPITLWERKRFTDQNTKQAPNDNYCTGATNTFCSSVSDIIIMNSIYSRIMVATLLFIVAMLAGVVSHGSSFPCKVGGDTIGGGIKEGSKPLPFHPLKNIFQSWNSSLPFMLSFSSPTRSNIHASNQKEMKLHEVGKDSTTVDNFYKKLEDEQTAITTTKQFYDESENDRYDDNTYPHRRRIYSLNDSLLCNTSNEESNHQPFRFNGRNSDSNSAILYMNETDYNLLKNITTSVGSFQPLPLHSQLSAPNTCATEHGSVRMMTKPKRFIPVLEARGLSDRDIDKNEFGHRRDTIPIAEAIDDFVIPADGADDDDDKNNFIYRERSGNIKSNDNENGVKTAVLQFLEDDDGQNHYAVQSNLALKNYLKEVAHGVVVRINPGTLSPLSQKRCDDMLRELSNEGVTILNHPDVSSTLGAKDSLVKIKHLSCGMKDTAVYYNPDSFQTGFRKSIAFQPRVLKQNRGSQGEGVWIVKLKDESAYCDRYGECMVDLDTELVLMEAFDNHVEHHTVGEFIDFCIHGRHAQSDTEWTTSSGGAYFDGGQAAGAMVVDQRFLPRIVEGEVRCLMVGSELVEILHKKPIEGGLSATLQSGATYTKYAPDHPKFAKLVQNFKDDVPHIMASFGMSDRPLPLLWTVDYIYGDSDDDLYAGEINCSCPGITSQLHITPTIAKAAFESVFVRR